MPKRKAWIRKMSSGIIRSVETVGKRVQQARERRGYGANELDHLLGKTSTGYTSKLENSPRNPGTKTLNLLAKVLNVEVAWLADGTLPMEKPARVEGLSVGATEGAAGDANEYAEIDPPLAAAINWARSAKYPEAVILMLTTGRKLGHGVKPLDHGQQMRRLHSLKDEYDVDPVGFMHGAPLEPGDLAEPKRGRKKP